jgi:hypothetical protein
LCCYGAFASFNNFISIEELKELNVELDFHFESKTLQDVKIDLMAKQHCSKHE